MLFDTLHHLEMEGIWVLQGIRGPWLNSFFLLLNFFDRIEFYLFLIPLIWYFISPRWGLRLFYLTIFNSLLNGFFKQIFQQPRPLELFPDVALLPLSDYGFPSGAAQTAVLLPYLLIKERKTYLSWIVGGSFFLLLSFSRVYLGVHFPSDIVGGWLIGFLLGLCFYAYGLRLESWAKTTDKSSVLLAALAIFTCAIALTPSSAVMRSAYCAMGASCGLYMAKEQQLIATTLWGRLLQALMTILTFFLLYFIGIFLLAESFPAHQLALKSLTYSFIGWAATFGIPYVQSRLQKLLKETKLVVS